MPGRMHRRTSDCARSQASPKRFFSMIYPERAFWGLGGRNQVRAALLALCVAGLGASCTASRDAGSVRAAVLAFQVRGHSGAPDTTICVGLQPERGGTTYEDPPPEIMEPLKAVNSNVMTTSECTRIPAGSPNLPRRRLTVAVGKVSWRGNGVAEVEGFTPDGTFAYEAVLASGQWTVRGGRQTRFR